MTGIEAIKNYDDNIEWYESKKEFKKNNLDGMPRGYRTSNPTQAQALNAIKLKEDARYKAICAVDAGYINLNLTIDFKKPLIDFITKKITEQSIMEIAPFERRTLYNMRKRFINNVQEELG